MEKDESATLVRPFPFSSDSIPETSMAN